MLPLCYLWEAETVCINLVEDTATEVRSSWCMGNKVTSPTLSAWHIVCFAGVTCELPTCCFAHLVGKYSRYSHTPLSCLISLLLLFCLRDFDYVSLFLSCSLSFSPASISPSLRYLCLLFTFLSLLLSLSSVKMSLSPSVSFFPSLSLWMLVPMVTHLQCVLFCCYGNWPTVGILLSDLCVLSLVCLYLVWWVFVGMCGFNSSYFRGDISDWQPVNWGWLLECRTRAVTSTSNLWVSC